MASRTEAKAKAKAERLEYERKLAEEARRKTRLQRLAGMLIVAAIIVVVAIVVSSSNKSAGPVSPMSAKAKANVARINTLLSGIPTSGNNTLGKPTAPVQVTEYGDLECSACDAFALPTNVNTSAGTSGTGVEDQLINNYVRPGKASLVYRSLDTATGNGATPQMFPTQQAAAYAAGLQGKAWDYIELFYAEQGAEGSTYVNQGYLNNLAKQVPGLNYNKWLSDLSSNSSLAAQVQSDASAASQAGYNQTPTIVVKGPKGQKAISGVPTYSALQQAITSVS